MITHQQYRWRDLSPELSTDNQHSLDIRLLDRGFIDTPEQKREWRLRIVLFVDNFHECQVTVGKFIAAVLHRQSQAPDIIQRRLDHANELVAGR